MTPLRSFCRTMGIGLIICAGSLVFRGSALAQTGSNLWTLTLSAPVLASPAIGPDGTIYAPAYENIYALTSGGSNKWIFPATNSSIAPGIYGSPAVGADGTIYFGGAAERIFYS